MNVLVIPAVLAAAIGTLLVASRRATTVCLLEIDAGVIRVKRGALAEPILADLADVVRRPPVRRATVRVSRGAGRAEVSVSGEVPAAQEQQLRNVIGRVPLARLENARARRR